MDTVIFDYRKERKTRNNTTTVELGPWLDVAANKKRIYNMRLFYVIKPVADNIVKFGVAGLTGDASAWGRLHQYINQYGLNFTIYQNHFRTDSDVRFTKAGPAGIFTNCN